MKKYTAKELIKKYHGKYIDTYPHHYEKWDDKSHKYITIYEVRGVKSTTHENYCLPEDCII